MILTGSTMNLFTQHTVIRYFNESLWRDEAFSWAMATKGLGVLPLTARDFNPPLYYLLLYGWMQVAGSSEAAMRSLSVMFFCGTLWVAWRFMIDLLDVPRRRAGLYLVLFAVNPMLSYYAVEARMYSMLAFLAACSVYAHLARRPVLYVVSTTAGLYTHYFMFLVVACQAAGVVFTHPRTMELRRRLWTMAAPPALFAPWLLVTVSLKEDYGSQFWVEPTGWKFVLHLVTSMYTGHDANWGFLERPERRFFALCLIPLVLWSLLAGYRWVERRSIVLQAALLALLPPAGIFLLSFVKPLFVPRYLIFSAVALVLVFVAGMERAVPRLRAAMFILLCALAVHYQAVQADRRSKGPSYRETLRPLVEQSAPQDLLFVSNVDDYFPAQYYFDRDRVYVFGERYEDIEMYRGKVLIPASRTASSVPGPPARVFLLHEGKVRPMLEDTAAAAVVSDWNAALRSRATTTRHVSWKK